MMRPTTLLRVDTATGTATLVGNMGSPLSIGTFTDIAVSPSGELWGITSDSIYKINITGAAISFVGNHGIFGGNALTFGSDGRLYAAGFSDTLYTINTATGVATALPGNMGTAAAGDLAFSGGQLYLAGSNGQLVRLDTKGSPGTGSNVGPMGVSNVFGLASDSTGRLLAAAGNVIYQVNVTTGALTPLVSYTGFGVANGATGIASGPTFQYPVGPNGWNKRAQGFGSLNHFLTARSRRLDPFASHLGQDWNIDTGGDSDKGKSVVAAADGRVLAVNYGPEDCASGVPPAKNATCESTTGWGLTILLEHDAPLGQYFLTGTGQQVTKVYTNYAHLLPVTDVEYDPVRNIQVGIGNAIRKGDPIGQVGTPPPPAPPSYHLHFEVLLQADPVTYRQAAGYGWDLTHYADASEFIDNNETVHFAGEAVLPTGTSVVVHAYGDGSTSPTLYVFLLDETIPYRGLFPAYRNTNGGLMYGDPCSATFNLNFWQRAGCDYGDYDLGYNGELFWKPADHDGTAKWIPNLPRDGTYQLSVFVSCSSPLRAHSGKLTPVNATSSAMMSSSSRACCSRS